MKSTYDKTRKIITVRQTLGPKLNDIDRSKRLAMRRAIKDRASLLVEMDWKKRIEEEKESILKTEQETRSNEKQVRETKTNHVSVHSQAAREMLERLELEREARLQIVHSRRNGGRVPFLQPQDRAVSEVLEPLARRQHTQPKIPIRIARSIARVCIEFSSANAHTAQQTINYSVILVV